MIHIRVFGKAVDIYVNLIQLCPCGDMRVEHEQMQLLLITIVMHGGDNHTAGVDTHHRARREIDYRDAGLADKLLRLVVCVDSGKDGAFGARTVVERELKQLFRLRYSLACEDLYCAEIGL